MTHSMMTDTATEAGRDQQPDPSCPDCFGTGAVATGGDEPHTAFSVACICTAPPSYFAAQASRQEQQKEGGK